MMKNYYIYKMIHVPSGRIYIGQRKVPKGKTPETDSYTGSGKIWREIYKKHKDECVKVIIDYADTKDEIDELEKKWIAYYRMTRGEFCVNIAGGGDGNIGLSGKNHPLYGKHCSEQTKEKLRKAIIGKKHSEQTKRKISEICRSPEVRAKMSESHKGKIPWNKGKKCPQLQGPRPNACGEKNHNFGKPNWNSGKKHSEELRKKQSEGLKAWWAKRKSEK